MAKKTEVKDFAVLTGYVSSINAKSDKILSINYGVKKQDGSYDNIFFKVINNSSVKVELKKRYEFTGFLAVNTYTKSDKTTQSEIQFIATGVKEVGSTEGGNEFSIVSRISYVHETKTGGKGFTLGLKDKDRNYANINAYAKAGIEIVENEYYRVSGFFAGSIFPDKEGKTVNRPQLVVLKSEQFVFPESK